MRGAFSASQLSSVGPKLKPHAGVVVENADDFVVAIGNARGPVGRVALGGDAIIPVVIGRGGFLDFNGFQPGIFARAAG